MVSQSRSQADCELTGFNCVESFDGTDGRERPTAAAGTLVLYLGYHILGAPVNACWGSTSGFVNALEGFPAIVEKISYC